MKDALKKKIIDNQCDKASNKAYGVPLKGPFLLPPSAAQAPQQQVLTFGKAQSGAQQPSLQHQRG